MKLYNTAVFHCEWTGVTSCVANLLQRRSG